MQLETTRFGMIEVEESDIITFTQPIIGFQEFRRFVLLPGPSESGLTWLQSTESGDLAFILMDPRQVAPEYTVTPNKTEAAELAINDATDFDVFTLVVVPEDRGQIRTNLKAPILINRKHRLGKQTILEKGDYPVRFFLNQAKDREVSQEISNARSNS